jgi:hypothetical protein
MWSSAAIDAGRTHEAAEGAALAVQLLPAVAWHGLDRRTRQEQLEQYAGVGCDAATCLVLDGRAESAVELLEQSRSVLWTQALNLRSDFTRLAEKAPDLAERLDHIRNFLDSPVPEVTSPSPQAASGYASSSSRPGDASELRRHKAREWDEVLAQVRALDGFEHFLAVTPYQELATALPHGPVVIVNVSRYGSHALIVRAGSEPVQVLSLPEVTPDATVNHVGKMLWALAGTADPQRTTGNPEEHRHALLDALDWAWDAIGEPVLTALGHTGPPKATDPWPRIRWCLTGPLAVLPIHAAGHHPRVRPTDTTDRTDCVLDRVISSYTPTLGALCRARHQLAPAPVRHLSVGMPTTPYAPPLPAVIRELEILARHFPPGQDNQQLVQSRAIRKDVLAAVADHSWVHMACHAKQEQAQPEDSGFALWDGMLTISDLAAQPNYRRDLAFLSACQTASGSLQHLDEAIHLAAAMQFLGYQHVIATMWVIADSPAPMIANAVYTNLAKSGRPETDRAAEALHYAIRSLRHTYPANPFIWAPYIHFGN